MTRHRAAVPQIGIVLLALAGPAWAGGFSIYEAGARATGLGCAFTATADDGSAMFYNIAGLSFLDGTRIDASLLPVAPKIKHRGVDLAGAGAVSETVDQSFPIPGFGVTHAVNDRWSVGLGLCAPFGLGVEWENPETWVGRFTSYDVDLQTIYLSPAVSFRVTPQIAVAVGADVAWQHIELNRYVGVQYGGQSEWVNAIDVQLSGTSDINVTPSVGLMVRPTPRLSFGAMYHHEKDMKFEGGEGTLSNVAPAGALHAAVDQQIAGLGGTSYDLSTEVGLPHMLSLGGSYQVCRRARVEVNAVHWSWSNFEQLALTFAPDETGDLSTVIPEQYEDVWQIRVGTEVDLGRHWSGLAGYVRDNTPQPKASMSPLLPDADRNDWSFGVQHQRGPWRVTASAMFVMNEERDNLVNGEVAMFPEEAADPVEAARKRSEAGSFTSRATVVALGVGYQF
jgi:long-chain fatty acid transport protein